MVKVTNPALKQPLTLQQKLVKIALRYFVNTVCTLHTSYLTKTKPLLRASAGSMNASRTGKLPFTKLGKACSCLGTDRALATEFPVVHQQQLPAGAAGGWMCQEPGSRLRWDLWRPGPGLTGAPQLVSGWD